jgi:uracil-DNA glycosylase
MTNKLSMLDSTMQAISECDVCCRPGQGIESDQLLRNFIAERPNGPRYGGIPHLFTDWANRLNAKIAVIGQDWGADAAAIDLRRIYEESVNGVPDDPAKIWRQMVKDRPGGPSKTDENLKKFFEESARLEHLHLPETFMDNLFITNAVLCLRKGSVSSGDKNINLERSTENCCLKRMFLRQLLEIVNPVIVVALGGWALWGLGRTGGWKPLKSIIPEIRRKYPYGYVVNKYDGLSLNVVPVYHPAAQPRHRKTEQQVEDYRFVWKSLSTVLHLSGDDLIKACFPTLGDSI